eukprot:Unigene14469_Nuclearia_a/m.43608 Unigene14469_Nuclearia_a/g.43608  ORF Unigene14469_Nuclearia_a/g.43608 Unigene14469_Nuclearia_a/m.43608 type:complete len:257 (-) Unigene14469_Nuclearia_a:42-812(-)
MGPVLISYREALEGKAVTRDYVYDRELSGKRQFASMRITLQPTDAALFETASEDNATGAASIGECNVEIDLREEQCQHVPYNEAREAVRMGVLSVLGRGPLLGYAVAGASVCVTDVTLTADSSVGAISACATLCVRELLRSFTSRLMEPMMRVYISMTAEHMGAVLADLTGVRRGRIVAITHSRSSASEHAHNAVQVDAEAPLEAMVGYSTALRSLSSGNASFSLQFATYRVLAGPHQAAVLEKHGILRTAGTGMY